MGENPGTAADAAMSLSPHAPRAAMNGNKEEKKKYKNNNNDHHRQHRNSFDTHTHWAGSTIELTCRRSTESSGPEGRNSAAPDGAVIDVLLAAPAPEEVLGGCDGEEGPSESAESAESAESSV